MQAAVIVTIFGCEQEAWTLILPLLLPHWEGKDPTRDYRSEGGLSWAILNPLSMFSCDQSSACDQDENSVYARDQGGLGPRSKLSLHPWSQLWSHIYTVAAEIRGEPMGQTWHQYLSRLPQDSIHNFWIDLNKC